jgi:hypothetical protein
VSGLYFLVSLVTLTLVIPYSVFSYFEEANLTVEVAVSFAIMLYTAVRLSSLAAIGRPHLLRITFFVFIYVWIGLAGTAQIIADDYPWLPPMHKEEDVLPALLEVVLAIVAFEAGYLWFRLRPPATPRAGGMFHGLNLVISDRAVVWLSVVSVLLTLIGMQQFGFNHLFLTRAAMQVVWDQSQTKSEFLLTVTTLRTPSLIAFNVIAYNALRRWPTLNRERKRFYFMMGALMGALYFVANYPPGQTRFWLGAVLLTPAFALPRWRRWFAPMWVLAFAVGLTVAFPYLDLFRRATTVEAAFQQLNLNEAVTKKMLHKGDYDILQMTLDGYRFHEKREGSSMGDNLVGAALFWVPRSIWTNKPWGTGQTVAESFGRSFTSLSAPLWMEFFYAFGWAGIAALMMLYARLCAWGENLYERSLVPGAPDSLSRLLVPYWAGFHMLVLRGDLLNGVAYPSLGLAMLLATAIAPRIWGRGPRPAPPSTRPANRRSYL